MNQKFQIDGDSPPPKRKQPLLNQNNDDNHNHRRRIGEVAGGATAECAVMCCCIPVAIINLLILAVYKVPAGLGKKVWRRKKKKRLLKKRRENFGSGRGMNSGSDEFDGCVESGLDFEDDEKWDELYGTGFWRVPSLKNEDKQEIEVVDLY